MLIPSSVTFPVYLFFLLSCLHPSVLRLWPPLTKYLSHRPRFLVLSIYPLLTGWPPIHAYRINIHFYKHLYQGLAET